MVWGGKPLARRENRGLIQHVGRKARDLGWETADPRKGKPGAQIR